MRKCLCLLLLCGLLLTGCGGKTAEAEPTHDSLKIVATIFPAYDFARAAAGDMADVELLLPPGTESHSYEPTPADILAVQDCDLFVYLGGESDTWVETILESIEMRGTALRMIDCVELLEEEHVEGMQSSPGHSHDHEEEDCHEEHHHHEEEDGPVLGQVVGMDEHVWTSPANAAAITAAIGNKLAELDGKHAEGYVENSAAYAERILELDTAFHTFFDSLPNRTIVFGDRFPLRYFAQAYDLDYYAAFPGCGTQTEPSAATIAFLTGKIVDENIPTIWYIEFSNHLVADSIAEAAKIDTAMFHTCHNVSKADLEAGATYLSLMEKNLETLKICMR